MSVASDLTASSEPVSLPDARRTLVATGVNHALHDGYTDLIYVLLPVWQAEFALGYAACFDSAMEIAAKQLKLSPEGARTSVAVGIGQQAAGGYALDLDITAHLPGMDDADAQKLVEATHQLCPYSNATRNNIDVRLHVITV